MNRTDYGKNSYLTQCFINCQSHTSFLVAIILHSVLVFFGCYLKEVWGFGWLVFSLEVPCKFFEFFLLEVWNGKILSTQTGVRSSSRECCLAPRGSPIAATSQVRQAGWSRIRRGQKATLNSHLLSLQQQDLSWLLGKGQLELLCPQLQYEGKALRKPGPRFFARQSSVITGL